MGWYPWMARQKPSDWGGKERLDARCVIDHALRRVAPPIGCPHDAVEVLSRLEYERVAFRSGLDHDVARLAFNCIRIDPPQSQTGCHMPIAMRLVDGLAWRSEVMRSCSIRLLSQWMRPIGSPLAAFSRGTISYRQSSVNRSGHSSRRSLSSVLR